MATVKAVVPALLMAAALVVAGHYSYASAPVARKSAHPHRKAPGKKVKKTARPASKAHKRAVRKRPASGGPVYTVTATTYQAVAAQTDSKPFVTADNSTIRRGYSSRLHWVAVSRDLLQPWGGRIHYGDKVRVHGVSPRLDGVYTVHDTMHRRHRRRVDILSSPREKLAVSSKNVQLQLMQLTATRQPATKPARLASHHPGKSRRVVSHPVRRHRGRTERPAYLTAAIL